MQILGDKVQKKGFAKQFYGETQQLQTLKSRKLQEEQSRDQYETQRVQKRQMDDWQRAE